MNSPVKLLLIPIRVLPLCETVLNEAGALCNETTEELTPANPFLEQQQKETPLDMALQSLQVSCHNKMRLFNAVFSLQNITARRNPNFYMISNMWGRVARFCLFKPAYKLGEDIIGTFDFTVATVNCMQVSVSLQCEEEICVNDVKQLRVVTFSKHHEVCLGYKYAQLILPIPLHVTPAFTTQLVCLRWRLHFEFVTSTSKRLDTPKVDEVEWRAPHEVPIETMVWSLPIRLYSTIPIHVAQGVQTNNVHKLIIR